MFTSSAVLVTAADGLATGVTEFCAQRPLSGVTTHTARRARTTRLIQLVHFRERNRVIALHGFGFGDGGFVDRFGASCFPVRSASGWAAIG